MMRELTDAEMAEIFYDPTPKVVMKNRCHCKERGKRYTIQTGKDSFRQVRVKHNRCKVCNGVLEIWLPKHLRTR